MLRSKLAIPAVLAIGIASPASGQMFCGEYEEIVASLEIHDERRTAAGVTSGSLVELFTAPTGTWTLLVRTPDGPTCLLAAGDGWQEDLESLESVLERST